MSALWASLLLLTGSAQAWEPLDSRIYNAIAMDRFARAERLMARAELRPGPAATALLHAHRTELAMRQLDLEQCARQGALGMAALTDDIGPVDRLYVVYEHAYCLWMSNRSDEAHAILAPALDGLPPGFTDRWQQSQAASLDGVCLMALHRHDEALRRHELALRLARDLDDDFLVSDALTNLAYAHLELENPDAVGLLAEAARRAPDADARLLLRLDHAEALATFGHTIEAKAMTRAAAREVAGLEPSSSIRCQALYSLGRVEALLGLDTEAATHFRDAAAIDADEFSVYAERDLGYLQSRLGDQEAALDTLERAIGRAPTRVQNDADLAWMYMYRSEVLRALDRPEASLASIQRALELWDSDEPDPTLYISLAFSLQETGSVEAAREAAFVAIEAARLREAIPGATWGATPRGSPSAKRAP